MCSFYLHIHNATPQVLGLIRNYTFLKIVLKRHIFCDFKTVANHSHAFALLCIGN